MAMKRRIVKHGNATLTVSLPSKWVKKYGLKKGDEVEITERENNLLLSPERREFSKSIELSIDNIQPPYMLGWILAALYKRGFDEIILTHEKPKPKIIYEILEQSITGFAVIEQTDRKCVLRAITKEEVTELDPIMKRVFSVINSYAHSSLECIRKGNVSGLEELFFLDKTMDKLVNFYERILVKKGYPEYEKTCFMYIIAWNLEKVSEYYSDICRYLIAKKKAKLGSEVFDLFERTNALLKLFQDIFYNYDTSKIVLLNKTQKGICSDVEKLVGKLTPDEIIVANHLREIATKLNCTGTLTALNYRPSE